MKPFLIAVSGGSGSGKTYLANQLINNYGNDKISLIQVDSYYKDLNHITMQEREKSNFDHPDAFDFDLLYTHIKQLENYTAIQIPSYDYTTHTRNNKTTQIIKTPIILLEGIFSMYYKKIRKITDLKVYLDTSETVRKKRRIVRDKKSRGRTHKSIIKQYTETVYPMYQEFVEPLMKYSDLIIKENSINSNGIYILNDCINSILDKNL